MEHLLINCSTCQGKGIVDVSTSPEPWVCVEAGCPDCDAKGYVYCDDDIDDRIEAIDTMIAGMMKRLAKLSKLTMATATDKYLDRMDTCARGLARLKQYRTKLINL